MIGLLLPLGAADAAQAQEETEELRGELCCAVATRLDGEIPRVAAEPAQVGGSLITTRCCISVGGDALRLL